MRAVNVAHPLVVFAKSSCSCMNFFVVHFESCLVSDKVSKKNKIDIFGLFSFLVDEKFMANKFSVLHWTASREARELMFNTCLS